MTPPFVGALPLEIAREAVDEIVLVTEAEILEAMRSPVHAREALRRRRGRGRDRGPARRQGARGRRCERRPLVSGGNVDLARSRRCRARLVVVRRDRDRGREPRVLPRAETREISRWTRCGRTRRQAASTRDGIAWTAGPIRRSWQNIFANARPWTVAKMFFQDRRISSPPAVQPMPARMDAARGLRCDHTISSRARAPRARGRRRGSRPRPPSRPPRASASPSRESRRGGEVRVAAGDERRDARSRRRPAPCPRAARPSPPLRIPRPRASPA